MIHRSAHGLMMGEYNTISSSNFFYFILLVGSTQLTILFNFRLICPLHFSEMFVVKNPDSFADLVIPQYFDHNSELTLLPSLIKHFYKVTLYSLEEHPSLLCSLILMSCACSDCLHSPRHFLQNSLPSPDS